MKYAVRSELGAEVISPRGHREYGVNDHEYVFPANS